MIAIAKSSGATDDWLIDFADETSQGFLLTAPVPAVTLSLVSAH